MDNLTHTMVGAALGQAGLKKYSGLGMATLMISANIPDVDVFSFLWTEPLAFRRGWTHGPLGLLILPAVLTGVMVGWDRLQGRLGKRPAARLPVRVVPLFLLACAGALTHPFLDWLNTYGIRFLMPFSHEWFYGDALFIIDPWIWLALGGGLWLSRRWEKRSRPNAARPAVITLAAVTIYVALMIGGSRVANEAATQQIVERGAGPVERLMAGPVPLNPFQRDFIADRGDAYLTGTLTFTPRPEVEIDPDVIPQQAHHPLVAAASESQEFRDFLYWARFPFFWIEEEAGGHRVFVADVRFARRGRADWASRSVLVE
jgi:inner membrane protein